MRKIIQSQQNKAKALEVRLENGEPGKYWVIVAGMTIQNYNPCSRGICEPTAEGEFFFIENDTFCSYQFESLEAAKELYHAYTAKYLS